MNNKLRIFSFSNLKIFYFRISRSPDSIKFFFFSFFLLFYSTYIFSILKIFELKKQKNKDRHLQKKPNIQKLDEILKGIPELDRMSCFWNKKNDFN